MAAWPHPMSLSPAAVSARLALTTSSITWSLTNQLASGRAW